MTRSASFLSVDVLTLFPELLEAWSRFGVTGRAVQQQRLVLRSWNPADYAAPEGGRVDDRPFGGGPGMVMMYGPLCAALDAARRCNPGAPVLAMSPQGRRLDQAAVRALGRLPGLILLAGRYAGIDQRVLDREVDEQWSIGDYVLSGGELPALVLLEALTRLLPGVLGNAESAGADSFHDGLLGHPHYTRPESAPGGGRAPQVLLGGDHEAIRRWRLKQSLGNTWLRRPELLIGRTLNDEQAALLSEFQREHAAAV